MDLKYIDSLDKRKKRHYCATRAMSLGRHGVTIVSNALGTDRKTIYRGVHELKADDSLPESSVRQAGGGRKCIIDKHPEYMDIFHKLVEDEIAGLPQNEDVRWLKSSPPKIRDRFEEEYDVIISVYVVRQLIARDNYKHRKHLKSLQVTIHQSSHATVLRNTGRGLCNTRIQVHMNYSISVMVVVQTLPEDGSSNGS